MRTSLLYAAGALLVLVCGAGYRALEGCPGPYPSMASAVIAVKLPADDKVFIDNESTTSTGGKREYMTPPLPFGRDLHYTLRVEVIRTPKVPETKPEPPDSEDPEPEDPNDPGPKPPPGEETGRKKEKEASATVIVTREITVRAGTLTPVDFGDITIRGKE